MSRSRRPLLAPLAALCALGAACITINTTGARSPAPVAAGLGSTASSAARSVPTPPAGSLDPESVGFSSERLDRMRAGMQKQIDDGALAGMVTLVSRHGRIAAFDTYGTLNVAKGTPVQKDSIFQIASMTKPITGVAMMILYEEGKWQLSDPVTKFIPELAGLKVRTESGRLEPIQRAMTMRELLNHTAGFAYGLTPNTPVDKLYRDAAVLDRSQPLEAMIGKLAKLPLAHQPGTAWKYSIGVDVQGYLVEKLSGQKLDEFLRARIFEPLGMTDTDFSVPPEKLERVASVHRYDAQGKLVPMPLLDRAAERPALLSGGGGLLSTAADYQRFCQMLLNGGELDGKRILAPGTVQLMRASHLPEGVKYTGNGGMPGTGLTFGLDFAVVVDPPAVGLYGKDTFFWGGAFGTWFWIDPANDLIAIGMIAQLGGSGSGNQPTEGRRVPEIRRLSSSLVYQALVDPAR